MAKCKNCGADLPKIDTACPDCGIAGGGQTITDLPGADTKGHRKDLFDEIKGEHERKTLIEGKDSELGASGGAETITDLPKVHLREAHRKLKEEIKEAREKDREERKKEH